MTSIEARRFSTCPACEKPIGIGDRIMPDPLDGAGETWVHEKCPPSRFDITREMCPECFTEKSVTGDCMCSAV